MTALRHVAQALDTEHRNSLDLLGRVEQALARAPRTGAARDPEFARLAAAFARLIEEDVARHFEFEERELFPRMAEAGEGRIIVIVACFAHSVSFFLGGLKKGNLVTVALNGRR